MEFEDIDQLVNAPTDPEDKPDLDTTRVQVPGELITKDSLKWLPVEYAIYRGLHWQEIETLRLRAVKELPGRDGKMVNGPFLIFPVPYLNKEVSWQGRIISLERSFYMSNTNIKHWLYPLNESFLEMYTDTIYIVEGVFDAIGLLRMGYPALCTFGKSISVQQTTLLKILKPKTLVFCWDLDAVSTTLTKSANRLRHLVDDIHVAIFNHAQKVDPGDVLRIPAAEKLIKEAVDAPIHIDSGEFLEWKINLV